MATDEKAVVSAGSSPTGLTSAPMISVPPRLTAAGAVVGLAAWAGAAVVGAAGAAWVGGGAGAWVDAGGAALVAAGSGRGGVGEHAASPRVIPPAPSHRMASRRLSSRPYKLLAEPVRSAVRVIVVPSCRWWHSAHNWGLVRVVDTVPATSYRLLTSISRR